MISFQYLDYIYILYIILRLIINNVMEVVWNINVINKSLFKFSLYVIVNWVWECLKNEQYFLFFNLMIQIYKIYSKLYTLF